MGSTQGARTLRSGMSEDRISGWWEEGRLVELWWGTYLSFHAVDGVDVSFEATFENLVLYPREPNIPQGEGCFRWGSGCF